MFYLYQSFIFLLTKIVESSNSFIHFSHHQTQMLIQYFYQEARIPSVPPAQKKILLHLMRVVEFSGQKQLNSHLYCFRPFIYTKSGISLLFATIDEALCVDQITIAHLSLEKDVENMRKYKFFAAYGRNDHSLFQTDGDLVLACH